MKHYSDTVLVQNSNGTVVVASGVNVTVLVTATQVPATIYSDDGVTPALNPLVTDSSGRFDFYVADGRYDLVVSGATVSTFTIANVEIADVTEATPGSDAPWNTGNVNLDGTLTSVGGLLSGNFSGNPTFGGNLSFFGANSHTGLETFTNKIVSGNLNNLVFVDGTQYATVQAAINALPVGATGGGTVIIPPGSYTCPTSLPSGVTLMNATGWGSPTAPPQIWSKFNGAPFNSQSAGVGSQNMVKFTSCTLNLTDVSQVGILGIVLDYNNTANMTIKGVSWSQFAMAVVNVPTTLPAISIIGDNTNNFNSHNNHFYYLLTEGGNIGVSIGNTGTNFATDNEFDWILTLADAQPSGAYIALAFVANCDSNHIRRHSAFATNAITSYQGEVYNTASTTADTDADSITVDMYDETMNGVPGACTSILLNPSKGNTFTTGDLACGTIVSVTSWSGTTTYTWFGKGANAGTPNTIQSNVMQALGGLLPSSTTLANINTGIAVSGTIKYCTDCAVGTDPCTGSSSGAIAFRLNGRWRCQ